MKADPSGRLLLDHVIMWVAFGWALLAAFPGLAHNETGYALCIAVAVLAGACGPGWAGHGDQLVGAGHTAGNAAADNGMHRLLRDARGS